MFKAKTAKIEKMAIEYKTAIDQIQLLFTGNVSIYIDYANVRPMGIKTGLEY